MKKNIILYTLIFLFVTFLSVFTYNYDFDLFARLEVGEIFFKLHKVLLQDPFSYTPTLTWYDHEWGSGVIFYAVYKLLGTAGFIILNSVLFTLSAIFVLKRNKNIAFPLLTSVALMVLMYKTGGFIIRCQAFSFCLIAIMLYILEKYRRENTNQIFFLPLIIAFWCNVHGGVCAGLGLICLYLVIMFIQKKNVIKLLYAVILSFLALLINPYGIKYPVYLLYTITMPRDHIADWSSIFHPMFFKAYIPIIILFLFVVCIKIYMNIKEKKYDIFEYLLLTLLISMSFAHIKTLEIASITLFMFCSAEVNNFLFKMNFIKNIEKSLYAVIILISLTIPLTITVPRVTFTKFPLLEAEFLRINNIKGNMLAPFDQSGYLSYKLFPNNLIFIDGRYDGVYPQKTFKQFINFCIKGDGWEQAFSDYPTDIIMVELSDEAYTELKNNKSLGWIEIYKGYLCGVFVKKENVKSFYLEPNHDINYYRENIFKTNFIESLREQNK